jgi:hypothetical protein
LGASVSSLNPMEENGIRMMEVTTMPNRTNISVEEAREFIKHPHFTPNRRELIEIALKASERAKRPVVKVESCANDTEAYTALEVNGLQVAFIPGR